MSLLAISARQLIRIVEDRLAKERKRVSAEALKWLVIEASEEYQLDAHTVKELAAIFKIPYEKAPPPYSHWNPGFSNYLSCVQYVNPKDPNEYILLTKPKKEQGAMEILHHKGPGFTSIEVFQKLLPVAVPDLSFLQKDFHDDVKMKHPDIRTYPEDQQGKAVRGSFTRKVSDPIRAVCTNLDAFDLRLIYTFMGVYVPEIEGICTKCFQVSFPQSGFGISYQHTLAPNLYYEIRISPEKFGGEPQQREIYITHRMNVSGEIKYIKWQPQDSHTLSFTEDVEDEITHLPFKSNYQSQVLKFMHSPESLNYFESLRGKKYHDEMKRDPTKRLVLPICQCQ